MIYKIKYILKRQKTTNDCLWLTVSVLGLWQINVKKLQQLGRNLLVTVAETTHLMAEIY